VFNLKNTNRLLLVHTNNTFQESTVVRVYLAMGKNTSTFRKFHAYNKFKSIVGVFKDIRTRVPLKKQWKSALQFEVHSGGSNGP